MALAPFEQHAAATNASLLATGRMLAELEAKLNQIGVAVAKHEQRLAALADLNEHLDSSILEIALLQEEVAGLREDWTGPDDLSTESQPPSESTYA